MAYVILRDNCKDKWEGKNEEFEKELKEFSRSRLPGERLNTLYADAGPKQRG